MAIKSIRDSLWDYLNGAPGAPTIASNLAQLAGTVISVGAGVVSAGVQRITLASDDPAVAGIGGVSDAKVDTDAIGSISGKLRGVVALISARLPTLGAAAIANSIPVTIATDEINFIDTSIASVRTAINGTSAEISSGLAAGRYVVWSDVDCYWRQGATGLTAVTTDRFLQAGAIWEIRVEDATTKGFIAIITGGISGNFYSQLLA